MDLTDPKTFSHVYDEHARSVYGAALRILGDPTRAQDVAHDVFLRVWRNPGRFDARRGDVGSYLRLIARSRALDVYREGQAASRARRRLELTVAFDADDGPAEDRPAPAAERSEQRAAVRAALRGLPEAQREALVLAHWGGLTAEEIADHSGIPLGTAKSRIRLGMAKLRSEPSLAA